MNKEILDQLARNTNLLPDEIAAFGKRIARQVLVIGLLLALVQE